MRVRSIAVLMAGMLATVAADPATVSIPTTVSPPWRQFYSHFAWPAEALPAPDDLVGWDAARDRHDTVIRGYIDPNLARDMHVRLQPLRRNGVAVLEVRPSAISDPHQVILYLHGGAYTFQSAELNVLQAALMANATKLRVVSVDYTLAPRGHWTTALQEVIEVYCSLLADGFKPASIGFFGDSAGGGLAAGAALKIRDMNLPIPGAIVLWSPWSDITDTGDTYATLAAADPVLSVDALRASAAAYAAPADQKNPYVSPVYGDYSKPYPPTLIQGGSREIFLSNFIRLYQAIDAGGGVAKLDLYEGMPHVFQIINADSEESRLAVRKSAGFMKRYLSR
jgi:monoterpene epsilon-lactone hydrolase